MTINTLDQYQELAMKTASPQSDITAAALGMCAESGEFADELKKYLYQNKPLNDDKLIRELGDVLWYVALGAQKLGLNLSTVALINIIKLQERHGEKFDPNEILERNK